jgi:steroid delta-isomerase-like uncharacterized protein
MVSRRILLAVVLGTLFLVPSTARAQDNQALVRRYIEEILNQGKLAVVDEIVASDYVGHGVGGAPEVKGREGLKQRMTMLRTAFPDVHIAVEDMVAAGEKVATRTTFHGTHKGEYLGIAPTDKTITATGIGIMHIANGKIQESWLAGDLLQQLGGGPKMAEPAKKK